MPQAELRTIVKRMMDAGESEDNIAAVIRRMSPPTATVPEPPPSGMGSVARDVAIGAAKGVGNTVFGLGKMVRDYTPVGRISDAIYPNAFAAPERTLSDLVTDHYPANPIVEALKPTNTAQRIGFGAEQIGEFFIPTGAVSRVGKAVAELGKSGVVTKAQTGDTGTAALSMGLTAAVPGAASLVRAGRNLASGAEKSVAQALGATKEVHKATAQKIAPEMLERGVGGSRPQMLERAERELAGLGPQMGAAQRAAAEAGKTVPGQVVRGELQFAREGLMVPNAQGVMSVVPGSERVVRQLQRMEDFVATLGDEIPFDKANRIKQAWDKIVAKGGLYGPKATATAADNAQAWATREGAGAFRKLLNDASPDLAALNKEYAFWKGLKDVLKATEARTQAQSGGLVASIGGVTGAASGFASGDSLGDSVEKALIGGVAGRQVIKLLQSPTWRTRVSGPLKFKLGNALASGHAGEIQKVARHIIESLPSQLRPLPVPSPAQ